MKKYISFIRFFLTVSVMSAIIMYFENDFNYKSPNFYLIILQSVITMAFAEFMLKRYSEQKTSENNDTNS
jgi:hypothetical protein